MTTTVYELLQGCVAKPIKCQEPMKLHTTFRIGGPADYLAFPTSVGELKSLLAKARELCMPVTIIGRGSNLLVRDKGIRGLVIKLGQDFSEINITGNIMHCYAGASLSKVAALAAKEGLSGLEFASGIPGSLGGAVYMNAGAYDGEMSNVVTSVSLLTRNGELREVSAADMSFGYRHSAIQDTDMIVVGCTIKLHHGDTLAIREKMADFQNRRVTKQPLEFPSAGSTFKRPPGYFAGTLIDQTGLKGYRVGDAQVSPKHAGFIVNIGEATCNDVVTLISDVQKRVYEAHGVQIHPEVLILGEE